METKELKITIPEGYCIDESQSTFEKIVFKKKDAKPRSWEDYCEQQSVNNKKGYYISGTLCTTIQINWGNLTSIALSASTWRNVLPSKELAEAFLAMMQLMSLRQAWIGDWESHNPGFLIMLDTKRNIIVSRGFCYGPLTFPTKEMAVDFMNTFKYLLEVAKPLI